MFSAAASNETDNFGNVKMDQAMLLISGIESIEFKNGKNLDSCIKNIQIGGMTHLTHNDESGCAGWQKMLDFNKIISYKLYIYFEK